LLKLTQRDQTTIELSPIELTTIVQQIINNLDTIYQTKKLIITQHIADNIIVNAHQDIVQMILTNLLDNAYKYTPE
jgi:signal transduction histidine kinase